MCVTECYWKGFVFEDDYGARKKSVENLFSLFRIFWTGDLLLCYLPSHGLLSYSIRTTRYFCCARCYKSFFSVIWAYDKTNVMPTFQVLKVFFSFSKLCNLTLASVLSGFFYKFECQRVVRKKKKACESFFSWKGKWFFPRQFFVLFFVHKIVERIGWSGWAAILTCPGERNLDTIQSAPLLAITLFWWRFVLRIRLFVDCGGGVWEGDWCVRSV